MNGTDKLIGDSLRAHPENLFSTLQEAKLKLMKGNYALTYVYVDELFPFLVILILYGNSHQLNLFNYGIINSAYRESGNVCKLTLAKEPLPMFIKSCAGLSKSGPYTKAIDQQLIFDIYNYNFNLFISGLILCLI